MKILSTLLITAIFASTGISSADDSAMLIRLYEEEILAHDLYVALSKEHPDVMPLKNIPDSEKRHQEIMAGILKERGINLPEPKAGTRFVTTDLDETFGQWLEEGKKSAAEACRVGVRLEEFDIADLREAQAAIPAHKDALKQLEIASENHLRAFYRNLTNRGGVYAPKALAKDDFNSILANEKRCCGSCRSDGKSEGKCSGKGACKTSGKQACKGDCGSGGKGPGKGKGRGKE